MRFTRKKFAALAAGVVTLSMGVGAYAYWTTSGSGEADATIASANGTLDLHATFGDGIYPGGSKTVTYTADNDGDTDLKVGTIHAVVTTDDVDCDAADFTIADHVSSAVVPANTAAYSVGSATLSMANSPSSQDACKGATLTLTLSSN